MAIGTGIKILVTFGGKKYNLPLDFIEALVYGQRWDWDEKRMRALGIKNPAAARQRLEENLGMRSPFPAIAYQFTLRDATSRINYKILYAIFIGERTDWNRKEMRKLGITHPDEMEMKIRVITGYMKGADSVTGMVAANERRISVGPHEETHVPKERYEVEEKALEKEIRKMLGKISEDYSFKREKRREAGKDRVKLLHGTGEERKAVVEKWRAKFLEQESRKVRGKG